MKTANHSIHLIYKLIDNFWQFTFEIASVMNTDVAEVFFHLGDFY